MSDTFTLKTSKNIFINMLYIITVNHILRRTTNGKLISFYCHASKDEPKRPKHVRFHI
jgi:hypothetical protein